MKTILVPTDGSVASLKALGVALDLAERHSADIKLIHVLLHDKEPNELLRLLETPADEDLIGKLADLAKGPPTPRSAEDIMANPNAPERPAPDPLLRKIGQRVLDMAGRYARKRGVDVEAMEIADGAAAPAIARAAKSQAADAVVMGMRGLRQIEAVTFGSVSQEVCRSVDCTCIAVN